MFKHLYEMAEAIEEPYRSSLERMIELYQDQLDVLSPEMQRVWLVIEYGNLIYEDIGRPPQLRVTLINDDEEIDTPVRLDWPVESPMLMAFILINHIGDVGELVRIGLVDPRPSFPCPFSRS